MGSREELKPKGPPDNNDTLALPVLQDYEGGLFLCEREVNSELPLRAHFDCLVFVTNWEVFTIFL